MLYKKKYIYIGSSLYSKSYALTKQNLKIFSRDQSPPLSFCQYIVVLSTSTHNTMCWSCPPNVSPACCGSWTFLWSAISWRPCVRTPTTATRSLKGRCFQRQEAGHFHEKKNFSRSPNFKVYTSLSTCKNVGFVYFTVD